MPISLHTIEETRQHCLVLATKDAEALAAVIRLAKSKKEFPDKYETALKEATEPLVSLMECSKLI